MNYSHWNSILASGVLAAYLVPMWTSFFTSEVFLFTNGWDEPTYLSWQGILGARNELGFFSLHLYGLLQQAGLSGAIENLLSDTFFPPATVLLTALSFRHMGITSTRSFGYAVITLFSSTLFNYTNPLFHNLPWAYENSAVLMTGMESYPSLLRTPNPQLSYFLIALAVYGWIRFRHFWILFLPLPFLYYFVSVPYVFLLAFSIAFRTGKSLVPGDTTRSLAAALVIYFCMGVGASVLFALAGYYNPQSYVATNPFLSDWTRFPQLPLALLLLAALTACLIHLNWLTLSRLPTAVVLALPLACLATVNLHVITGFMLSQKNYYDYGLSILFGLILVLMIDSIKERRSKELTLVIMTSILIVPTLISHLYFYRSAATISQNASTMIDDVRKSPFYSIISDVELSSRMAYSTAGLVAPVFSYHYFFPFIEKQCRLFPLLLEDGLMRARKDLATDLKALKAIETTVESIRQGQKQSQATTYRDLPYCEGQTDQTDSFRVLTVKP